jgi:asparagine synthase (glutamine-hydrolysing)
MCGIAGILGARAVNAVAVQAMTDVMAHRGPDGEGQWISDDGRVCFGHRRLAIIDITEKSAQPMLSADGALTITFNGEIYNYKELRTELQSFGAKFTTDSDTEVLLSAYAAWGDACLDRLNGMFAFAIHDKRRKVVFCGRDRFGEKPFLFTSGSGFVAFASEYKALLSLAGVSTDIDDIRLMRFFADPASALDQERASVFTDICQLGAGEKMYIDTETLEWHIERYWHVAPPDKARAISLGDAAQHLRDLLEDSVRLRMRSDVALGSCLSGGLDSSAITCIARNAIGRGTPYQVFTGRFPGSAADEGSWAKIAADTTSAEMHETFPDGEGLRTEMDEFIWMNELPVDSASQYAQWSVFRLARENGVTVLLDGQGSDEILAGYEQYFSNYVVARKLAGGIDDTEIDAINARYPLALSMRDNRWKTVLPFPLRRSAAHILGRGSDVRFGMHPEIVGNVIAAEQRSSGVMPLIEALQKDACQGFLATLLRYGDRNSMAHSREVRLPFCDHRIIEFVMTLPVEMLMRNAETKHLLREAMRGILPDAIRTRWLKQGFLPPITDWLQGSLGNLAADVFQRSAFRDGRYWDAPWWDKALSRFRKGEQSLATNIWKPMMCQLWLDGFVARAARMDKHNPLA